MRTGFYIFILVALSATSCRKKEYPVPVNTSEVTFYTKLLVNGQPLEINAGNNGYYMYSSYELDHSGIYNLLGAFRQTGCDSNCPNSIQFRIYDSKISSLNDAIDINNVLKARNYDFWTGDTINAPGYSVSFYGSSNKPGCTFLWHFDDGGTSAEQNPVHTFNAAGIYQATLVTTAPDQSQSTIVNSVYVDYINDLNACVTTVVLDSNVLLFKPHVIGGIPPYSYFWNFGDGATATGDSVSHYYSNKGGYATMVSITDAQGEVATCRYNAVTASDHSALAANFSFPGILHSGRLSKAVIQYTDASGNTFTSDNSLQPSVSSFQVLSVEDFVKNENNQPVKKAKLKFNCTLYHGAQSVSLQGAEVTVGFAYK